MYMMIGTRPNIDHLVGVISRFMANPTKKHWLPVKWVLRYIRGISNSRLVFQRRNNLKLVGYNDSDFATDLDKRRSITGFVFTFGGTVIYWKSSLQKVVDLSTTEAEYIALLEEAKEATWLRGLLEECGYGQEKGRDFL